MLDKWKVSLNAGDGDLILFEQIRVSMRFLINDFKRTLTYSCLKSLFQSHIALKAKHS